VQRLFSNFASGWPGAGVLLLRLIAGFGVLYQAIPSALSAVDSTRAVPLAFAGGCGVLLVIGLCTPYAGVGTALIESWMALTQTTDPLAHVVLIGIGLGLAMIGPGAWSVDARLFGRKQIDLSALEKSPAPTRKWDA
jgi:uncharacterized membrane protein YphA (DoxX/SURF4 family)